MKNEGEKVNKRVKTKENKGEGTRREDDGRKKIKEMEQERRKRMEGRKEG